MKHFLSIVFCFLMWSTLPAQSGANIKAGVTRMTNQIPEAIQSKSFQSGYHVGLDARFGKWRWYLGPGLYWHNMSLLGEDEFSPFAEKTNIHILKIPVNVGCRVWHSRMLTVRAYAGPDINYILSIENNDLGYDLDDIQDLQLGLGGGIGIDLFWLTFDVTYERGVWIDTFRAYEGSRSNYVTASLGFFF